MTGFEPWSSGIGSDRIATTTVQCFKGLLPNLQLLNTSPLVSAPTR